MLDESTTQAYWDDGYLFPLRVMPEQQAQTYRKRLEEIEQSAEEHALERPLRDYIRVHSEVVMPLAAEMALNAAVLDAVESVIGPNIMIWGAEFFIKEPNSAHRVSMHQDLTYWGFGETSNQVTAWIALSPSTVNSGCMDLVRGSHKQPILPHNDTHAADNLLSRGQEVAVEVKDHDKTHVELQAGEMSLHHGLAIHGSDPNCSDDRRIGFAIRYINPDARQRSASREFAMLARGVDSTTAFIHYAAPVSLFSNASLELYETIRAEQSKVLGAGMKADQALYQSAETASPTRI